MGGGRAPSGKSGGAGKKPGGGGVWGIFRKIAENVSIDINVGGVALSRKPSGNPADPRSRAEPIEADRKETYDEMIYRTTDGADGQAPMVRVGRDRRHIARSLETRGADAKAANIPSGGGEPLSRDVRARMEPRLGADLSGVRVHKSGESGKAAEAISAKAFTVGSDVHFAGGNYEPGTKEGDRLLAHELTHVVQAQRSGIQRKPNDDGGDADHAADEQKVSEPHEPAEKEADAVADKVTDELHATGSDKGKKDDKKDKDKGHAGGGANAHDKGAAHDQHAGGGAHGPRGAGADEHGGEGAQATGGAKADGAAGGESKDAAPIGAQLSGGVGRKVFRSPRDEAADVVASGKKIFRAKKKPPTPPAATAPPTTGAAAAPAAAADPDLTLAQIQDEIVNALKAASGNKYTPAEVASLATLWAPTGKLKKSQVTAKTAAANLEQQLLTAWRTAAGDAGFCRAFCAQDPIAMRNLNQVDNANATYFDGGAAALAKHSNDFFAALAPKLSAGGVKRTNCFSPYFNDAAGPVKFKGMTITSHVPQFLQRSISITDFFKYSCNKDQVEKEALADYNNQRGTKHTLVKFRALKCHDDVVKAYFDGKANDGAWIQSIAQGNLTFKPNWWTPNQLKVQGGEVGFSQLMTLIALEPQWFAEGAIFITVDTKKIPAGVLEARKPTCFDGMGSAMWVPREQGGETFGVTGGGIQEMLCQGISASDVVKWQPKIPSGDLQAAIKKMDDEIKATEPGASAVNQHDRGQGNPGAQSALHQQAQNTGPGGKKLANLNQSINDRTQEERGSPTANPAATTGVAGVAAGKPTLRT